jgi:hypothetical protein
LNLQSIGQPPNLHLVWDISFNRTFANSTTIDVEIFPAFDYARGTHTTGILLPNHPPGCLDSKTVIFSHADLDLQLDVTIDHGEENVESCPVVNFRNEKKEGMLGEGVAAHIHLQEGQAISFVLRDDIPNHVTRDVTTQVLDLQQSATQKYWFNWISKSKYKAVGVRLLIGA